MRPIEFIFVDMFYNLIVHKILLFKQEISTIDFKLEEPLNYAIHKKSVYKIDSMGLKMKETFTSTNTMFCHISRKGVIFGAEHVYRRDTCRHQTPNFLIGLEKSL